MHLKHEPASVQNEPSKVEVFLIKSAGPSKVEVFQKWRTFKSGGLSKVEVSLGFRWAVDRRARNLLSLSRLTGAVRGRTDVRTRHDHPVARAPRYLSSHWPGARTKSSFSSPLISTTIAPDSGESQYKSRATKKRIWSLWMVISSSIATNEELSSCVWERSLT